jgi:hypothetical protein
MVPSTTERVAIVELPVETRLFMETLAACAQKYVNSPAANEHAIQNIMKKW